MIQITKIKADIYPGLFDREYQVTIRTEEQEVHLFVGEDFVQVEGTPLEEGTPGFLMVEIVGYSDDGNYLVALPGEPQGATGRVTMSKEVLLRVGDLERHHD